MVNTSADDPQEDISEVDSYFMKTKLNLRDTQLCLKANEHGKLLFALKGGIKGTILGN